MAKIGIIKRKEDNYLNIYVDAINTLGAEEEIIDNSNNRLEIFNQLSICDGIIFTGGTNWEPVDEDVLRYCLENDVPFLGICLGMQMIGNYFSPDHEYGVDKTVKIDSLLCHNVKKEYSHRVLLKEGLLSELLKSTELYVNSYHNCCVNYTDDSIIKGYSEDGIIEALEIPNHSFGVGVQWHPEKMLDYDGNSKKILGSFLDAADYYAYKKRGKVKL